MRRAYNFNAGPSALPREALEQAQTELVDFGGTGMSVMELSHRSQDYEAVHHGASQLLRELMEIPEDYDVLFVQGGASLQFAMVPLNVLTENTVGNYVLTGSWSEKARKEGALIGQTTIGASTKETNYTSIPRPQSVVTSARDAYVHITSNNTIYGTQWSSFPAVPNLIADMSSDILSRRIDVSQFGLIYAGAQKNLGPAGVTVVIIRKELVAKAPENVPTMLRYDTYASNKSLYNTPPTFAIYLLGKVLSWVKNQGGVAAIAETNAAKANLLYEAIDHSDGFYRGHAEPQSRSMMNVTFNLATEERNKTFLAEAKERGFIGINGHRSVGGCRASIYNAVPMETCEALRDFMESFRQAN